MKKKIVVSAINFYQGGPLTILKNCLEYLNDHLSANYEVIALVNKNIFDLPGITFYEFPLSRKSWLYRLYYEFIYFKFLSKKIGPYLWLSLHDITPNVSTEKLAVYCHNPAPFYKLSLIDCWLEPRFVLFNLFYRFLYAINIKNNDHVIVQQDWIRKHFINTYNIDNVVVASPFEDNAGSYRQNREEPIAKERFMFFYPSLSRCFKNFEVVCEAAKHFKQSGRDDFEVYFTINGKENKYAKYIYNKYKSIGNIKFVGQQSRGRVFEYYKMADCLIFPSKLETWGLPISEFKAFGKPILIADAEYAPETVGVYDRVKYFAPDDPIELADHMQKLISHKLQFDPSRFREVSPPYTANWQGLFDILLA